MQSCSLYALVPAHLSLLVHQPVSTGQIASHENLRDRSSYHTFYHTLYHTFYHTFFPVNTVSNNHIFTWFVRLSTEASDALSFDTS